VHLEQQVVQERQEVKMIEKESVIPVHNGFYTANKVNPRQDIFGKNGLTYLTRIDQKQGIAILIETKHYSIIASPQQSFFTNTGTLRAEELTAGTQVLTDDGYEKINITVLDGTHELYNLITEDGTFKANGFVLRG